MAMQGRSPVGSSTWVLRGLGDSREEFDDFQAAKVRLLDLLWWGGKSSEWDEALGWDPSAGYYSGLTYFDIAGYELMRLSEERVRYPNV